METAGTISEYIVSFAAAAATAQGLMSKGVSPMVIKEFNFEVELDLKTMDKVEGDISIKGLFAAEAIALKSTFDYENSQKIKFSCKLAPILEYSMKIDAAGSSSDGNNR